ncbi:MAG: hypothetical protein S4CHLAM102_00050 [Chlamydiia bacterium]|nr:hypothetical protein [Chlamydiia bacterium]
MRSRYAAYAMGNSAYIIKTTHPENPQYSENKQEWSASIHQFSSETKFVNLEIIEESEDAMEAFITFKATLVQGDRDASFTEKSRFLKVDGRWLYHSGTHF